MRSIQSLRAMLSPSSAFDIAVWVKASACPSSRLSIAMVALLREPLGALRSHLRIYHPYFYRFACLIIT
jgi:hypothetical protein